VFIILIHSHVAVTPVTVSLGYDEISVITITLLVDCHTRLCGSLYAMTSFDSALHQIVTSISLYSWEHWFAIRGKTEDSSNFRKLLYSYGHRMAKDVFKVGSTH